MLNSQVTTAQHVEREKAYDIVSDLKLSFSFFLYIPTSCAWSCYFFSPILKIASLLKIPFIDEDVVNNSFQQKVGWFTMHILLLNVFFSFLLLHFHECDNDSDKENILLKLTMKLILCRRVVLMYYLNKTVRKRVSFHGLMCSRKVQVHPCH